VVERVDRHGDQNEDEVGDGQTQQEAVEDVLADGEVAQEDDHAEAVQSHSDQAQGGEEDGVAPKLEGPPSGAVGLKGGEANVASH